MKKIFVVLLAFCYMSVALGQQKVAVYITGGGQYDGIKKVLGDQLVAAFSESGRYVAVERTASFLAALINEQSGAVTDREIVQLGQQFGVQLVCIADLSEPFAGQKYVSARLINVENALVVNTANASSPLSNMDELLKVSKSITTTLTSATAEERIAQKEQEEKRRQEQAAQEAKERAAREARREFRSISYYNSVISREPESGWKDVDVRDFLSKATHTYYVIECYESCKVNLWHRDGRYATDSDGQNCKVYNTNSRKIEQDCFCIYNRDTHSKYDEMAKRYTDEIYFLQMREN